jgi:aldehyde dehydrogenase (NAD+)
VTLSLSDLMERRRHYIDGRWTDPAGGGLIEVTSPATERVVGHAPLASVADVDRAVAAARRSFDSGVWTRQSARERAAVMVRAADIIEAHAAQVAEVITSELGCPHSFSVRAHVPSPIRHLRYYASIAGQAEAEDQRDDGRFCSAVITEPVGVVGAITPWNGPLSNPMLKVAPALAAGCSIVVKPAPEAPLAAFILAEALDAAGLPPGVFNLVPGGRDAGRHLGAHRDVDKVAFTGSTAAGRAVMASCASRIARVTLELGGKSAAVILDDADLDEVVRGLLPMALVVNGQACIAQTRILAPRHRYDDVVAALRAGMELLSVGDPFDPETDIGPLVSRAQRERVEGYLAVGVAEGAKIVTGGGRPQGLTSGWYVQPTVFANVDNSMRIAREEIFGPVIGVTPYDDESSALTIANDSMYGLSGSVWSTDPARAMAVARGLRTGMVSINGAPQAYGTPFGGFKQSGLGREMGPEGLQAYLEKKSVALGELRPAAPNSAQMRRGAARTNDKAGLT